MNNGFGYTPAGFTGMGVNGVTPSPETMNGIQVNPWLTPEDINMLRKDTEQFSLSITNEELKRAMCNHRDLNRLPSLKPELDGSCTCTICGYNFNVTEEFTQEQVNQACRVMENLLQTIKLMYISLNPETGKEFFQILAFIKKIPKLYEIASNDFKKYEGVYTFNQGIPANTFAIFGSLTTPGAMYNNGAMGYTGQPNYAYQPQQTMYGAPQPQPGYGYQQPQMGNPFYQMPQTPGYVNPGTMGYTGQPAPSYGAPQPTTQPNQGFAMNPTGAAAPAAPQAPSAPTSPTGEGTVNVAGEYKA